MPEQVKNKQPILITGGHMTPALAVMDELRGHGFAHFIWVGHKYSQADATDVSQEYKTVSKFPDTKFINLRTGKLVRSWYRGIKDFVLFLKNLLRIPWGFIKAWWIVARYNPKVVVTFGGYLAVPIVIAAWSRSIPIITHEQTVIAGLANKIIAKFARKILISWPGSAKYYPATKTIHTGNPVRAAILEARSNEIQFSEDLPIVYITGGNQGAYVINRVVFTALPELLQHANIIHQTGEAAPTMTALGRLQIPPALAHRYMHQAYFSSEVIGEVFAKSTLIVSRAGANSMTEILRLHKPTIFVPIPWVSHNEQYLNAKTVTETGLAVILPEAELTPQSLIQTVTQCLATLRHNTVLDGRTWEEAVIAADTIVVPDATTKVVAEILPFL